MNRVVDSFASTVPPGFDREDTGSVLALTEVLRGTLAPGTVLRKVDWTFTDDVAEAEAWPLPHDCDDCREGRDGAAAFLRDHPGRHVALARIEYDEPE